MFDYSVNLGNLLALITAAAGAFWFFAQLRTDLQVLVTRIGQFDHEMRNFDARLDKLAEALVQMVRQEERQNAFEARLERLERSKRPERSGDVVEIGTAKKKRARR